MLKCFGCKRNTGKKRNTVPNLPPGVFNIIGKKLSNRNAVALALASKGVHEVLSPNLARRKMAEFHGMTCH